MGRLLKIAASLTVVIALVLPGTAFGGEEAATPGPDVHSSNPVGEWRPGGEADQTALSINEPMYLVAGRDGGDTLARFQFSFKYRMFDSEGAVVQYAPWLERLHFGYTQTALWNLSADSKPFEDSSYRPSLFWEFRKPRKGAFPDFLRAGYEHESNGQGGVDSRSIDTLFILPAWETRLGEGSLFLGTKLYAYLDQDEENSDIEDYRGYGDLILRFGYEDGWLGAVLWRYGMENRNTVQVDLSYPIRKPFLARAGGYFYLQAFHGYGESLLRYNQNKDLAVRVGFAIVR